MTGEGWKRLIFIVVAAVYGTLLLSVAVRRREDLRRVLFCLVLGWLIPGAGHMWLGRIWKGIFLFALVAGTFGAGCVLARGRTVTFDENPFYYIGQIGSGMTLGVTGYLSSEGMPPRKDSVRPSVDAGLLYMSVAGLLNLLLILNLYDLLIERTVCPAGGEAPAAEKAAEGTGPDRQRAGDAADDSGRARGGGVP